MHSGANDTPPWLASLSDRTLRRLNSRLIHFLRMIDAEMQRRDTHIAVLQCQATPMSNPADTPLHRVTSELPKPRIMFEAGSALLPIKLARATQGSSNHWLFRVGVYEHQESYGSEREAMESAERLLFTLFRDIADEQVMAALRLGDTALAMRYAERRATGRDAERKRSCISSP